jgi:class 3 adenylate cyclase
MVERNAEVAPDKRIEFRVGIHLGDVVEESDGDLMGDGVTIRGVSNGTKLGSTARATECAASDPNCSTSPADRRQKSSDPATRVHCARRLCRRLAEVGQAAVSWASPPDRLSSAR